MSSEDWDMDGDDGSVAKLSIGLQNLQRGWVYPPTAVLVDTVETNKGSSSMDKGKAKGKGKLNIKGNFSMDKGKAKGKGLLFEAGKASANEKRRQGALATCLQALHQGHYMTHCDDKDTESRMGTSEEKNDLQKMKQYGDYTYVCQLCVARRDSITMPEAARVIKQPRTAKGMDRCKKFEFAKLEVQATFTFLYIDLGDDVASTHCPDDDDSWSDTASACGASSVSDGPACGSASSASAMSNKQMKKEIRNRAVIKASTMTSFFAPMAEILFLKNTDMEAAVKAAGCRSGLITAVPSRRMASKTKMRRMP